MIKKYLPGEANIKFGSWTRPGDGESIPLPTDGPLKRLFDAHEFTKATWNSIVDDFAEIDADEKLSTEGKLEKASYAMEGCVTDVKALADAALEYSGSLIQELESQLAVHVTGPQDANEGLMFNLITQKLGVLSQEKLKHTVLAEVRSGDTRAARAVLDAPGFLFDLDQTKRQDLKLAVLDQVDPDGVSILSDTLAARDRIRKAVHAFTSDTRQALSTVTFAAPGQTTFHRLA